MREEDGNGRDARLDRRAVLAHEVDVGADEDEQQHRDQRDADHRRGERVGVAVDALRRIARAEPVVDAKRVARDWREPFAEDVGAEVHALGDDALEHERSSRARRVGELVATQPQLIEAGGGEPLGRQATGEAAAGEVERLEVWEARALDPVEGGASEGRVCAQVEHLHAIRGNQWQSVAISGNRRAGLALKSSTCRRGGDMSGD